MLLKPVNGINFPGIYRAFQPVSPLRSAWTGEILDRYDQLQGRKEPEAEENREDLQEVAVAGYSRFALPLGLACWSGNILLLFFLAVTLFSVVGGAFRNRRRKRRRGDDPGLKAEKRRNRIFPLVREETARIW